MSDPKYAYIVSKMLAALPGPAHAPEVVAPAIAEATAEATCAPEWPIADCVPIWPLKRRSVLTGITVTVGYFESGFQERIGASKCRKHECDAVTLPGGRVFFQALGYWQSHKTGLVSWDEWREARGAEYYPTFVQARIAIRAIAAGANACRKSGEGEIGAAISGFATGGRCYWKGTPTRERFARSLIQRFGAEM